MKRKPVYAIDVARAYKKRRIASNVRPSTAPLPRRGYPLSRVPLASRGYRLNSIEKKHYTITNTGIYQANTSTTPTLLCIPQLGTDFNARIGRKIVIKSFYIKGYCQSEASRTTPVINVPAQQLRLIVFCDLQPNGAAPAITDLLDTANTTSMLNLNNRDRFIVYTDKIYPIDPYFYSATATQSFASVSNQIKNVKKYKKINLEVIFNSTNGGTIADITSGALYMWCIGSQAAGANTDGNFLLSTRVRYVDP